MRSHSEFKDILPAYTAPGNHPRGAGIPGQTRGAPLLRGFGPAAKILSEADESKTNDSHALASAQLKPEFEDADQSDLARIRTRALELFYAHTKKMEEKYGGQRMNAANSD